VAWVTLIFIKILKPYFDTILGEKISSDSILHKSFRFDIVIDCDSKIGKSSVLLKATTAKNRMNPK